MTSPALAGCATALYRFFDASGALLYVGITANTDRRFGQHAADKDWWPDVDHDRTAIVWFDSRVEAELAELIAHHEEKPRHGGTWGRRPWTPETATPEQLRLREAAIDAFQRAGLAEAEGYAFAGQAHAAGVPMEDLAEQTGKSRATLFRNAKKPGSELVSEPFEDPA